MLKIKDKKSKDDDKSSTFSKFFRNASSGEKKRVFLDVAKKASKKQFEVIKDTSFAR